MSDRPDRERRDRVAAAATVAVVLALGATYAVVRGERDRGTSSAGSSSGATGLGPCGAGDLVAGRDTMRVATGTTYLTAALELTPGAAPCTVEGYPTVIALSEGRPAGVETVTDGSLGKPRRLAVLPERPARVTLGWSAARDCGPVVEDAVRLWVAPDLHVEVPGYRPAACSSGESRARIRVGAYAYVDPLAAQGTVTGVVTLNTGPGPGTGEFVTTGVVTFESGAGSHQAAIGSNGTYERDLPAGRYRVSVTTHQWPGGRPYSAGSTEVRGGELHQLSITLQLR